MQQTLSPDQITNPEVLGSLPMDLLTEMLTAISGEIHRRHSEGGSSEMETAVMQAVTGVIAFDETQDLPADQYEPLPAAMAAIASETAVGWRILLTSSDPHQRPIAIHALGDIVVGRRTQGVAPDLDFSRFDRGNGGISRIHALIRPTADQLQLSDLGSTNGTFVDGERLVTGRTVALKDEATITFGRCNFKLRIIERPNGR